MITPSFGLTATERVLPKLALDFTTGSLDSRITFTRTTSASNPATYVNSSGVVTAATNDQPRFDYDPVTLACKGLLIEESRTNLYKYSNDFSQAAFWNYKNNTVSTDVITAPDNTTTADKIIENTATSAHYLGLTEAVFTASAANTVSVFAKAGERGWLFITGLNDSNLGAYFDLVNGVVGTRQSLNTSATITPAGNGWYRCTITFSPTKANPYISFLIASANNTSSYMGDGTSGLYLWGAQLEAGAFATSYIPTTTTSLTRNADQVTMTGTNFSDWYTSTGSISVDVAPLIANAGAGKIICSFYNTGDGTKYMRYRSDNGAPNFFINGGGDNADFYPSGSFVANTFRKFASAFSLNNSCASFNGGAVSTDTAVIVPTVDALSLSGNTSFIMKSFNFYPQRLINAEVQAFSK